MKKSLRVLFCLLLVVAMVAGCGQIAADTPTTDKPAQEAEKPAEKPNKPSSPVTGETLSTGYILLMLALVVAFVSKKKFA